MLGKRSHNIDKAIFGQIDFKQLGGGDGTKPVWHAGGRPWILRFNTIRKGAASQGNETLVCVMANKDVRFCPLLSVGIKELYPHATAGLAKPPSRSSAGSSSTRTRSRTADLATSGPS